MPELPEVETFARQLKPALVGKKILDVDLRWKRTLATHSPKKFKEQIVGQQIVDVSRRAKFLDLQLTDHHLLIHLRMSGDLLIRSSTIVPNKHDRLIIKMSGNRSLVFNDTRKFGRIWLVEEAAQVTGSLGPEPFNENLSAERFFSMLQGSSRQVNPSLLNQGFLAGLGNIYSDEGHRRIQRPPRRPGGVPPRRRHRSCAALDRADSVPGDAVTGRARLGLAAPTPRATVPTVRERLARQPDEIRQMFAGVAARYDLLNRTLSLRRDVSWRRSLVAALKEAPSGPVLDLGTGTGDVALAATGRTVVGLDFCLDMLALARARPCVVVAAWRWWPPMRCCRRCAPALSFSFQKYKV